MADQCGHQSVGGSLYIPGFFQKVNDQIRSHKFLSWEDDFLNDRRKLLDQKMAADKKLLFPILRVVVLLNHCLFAEVPFTVCDDGVLCY